jgi:pimeloyl-ACP methyl ester carboxylesterase
MADIHTNTYPLPFTGGSLVELVVEERGEGPPFLLLHGGAGPVSMARFASLLVERQVRVLTPTHPGFAKTKRPVELNNVKGLAQVYAALLDHLNLRDVTVIGNSVGGWIASELSLQSPRVRVLVLVGATGIVVPGHPIADISGLSVPEIMRLSYHNPKPFAVDPATMTDEQRAVGASNRAALQVYAPQSTDPTLANRLAKVSIPVLVISGQSDRIVDPEYGRALAAAIPGAMFQVLPGTGHLPQIETPQLLLDAIWSFKETRS